MSTSSSFQLARLRKGLRPFRLHWYSRLRSTNDHAAAKRRRGELFAPSVVLTSRQIAGRGRGSNTWWSAGGALTVTFVLPIEEHLAAHQVPLISGMAVRDACEQLTGHCDIQLKWPNDILFHGRKVAGLLCERLNKVDLIGLGLNVNVNPAKAPPSLRQRLISLATIAGKELDLNVVLITVAGHLHRMLAKRNAHPFQGLLREYDQHHALVGRNVSVMLNPETPQISGRCEGIDDTGRLLVRQRKTLHRIIAGQIISRQ
jgi:BirA family biotin operon repressor/biotin-[acetyl-CoA-carboxylase] ligase